jgi:hypothetical protein
VREIAESLLDHDVMAHICPSITTEVGSVKSWVTAVAVSAPDRVIFEVLNPLWQLFAALKLAASTTPALIVTEIVFVTVASPDRTVATRETVLSESERGRVTLALAPENDT